MEGILQGPDLNSLDLDWTKAREDAQKIREEGNLCTYGFRQVFLSSFIFSWALKTPS
jgi:hypothetical protein